VSFELAKNKTPLLPDRYPIDDFFICDVIEASPKDDLASMEHPVYSLSTKPDVRVREYEHNGVTITVAPSALGLATIHDKDILIYCISQLIAKINAGQEASKVLHLKAYDLLVATNRKTDGRGYEQLEAALDRLSGTRIKTNIKTNDERTREGFGLIDSWKIVTREDSDRMAQLRITLSDWVFNAVLGQEVLTLHRNYFRLRKPLERRMYELARKHCGRKDEWKISLELLQKKCGSASTLKEFRRLVANIAEEDQLHQHMPDYSVILDDDDMLVFRNRGLIEVAAVAAPEVAALRPETYAEARNAAPGWDIYVLEREWRDWMTEPPRNADAAFVGFCRKWYERRGRA
jgi:plasmid replication initiation protein